MVNTVLPLAQAPANDLAADRRPYQPYGSALAVLQYKGPEVLLSGPAGSGKTRGVLEKLHLCAERFPGMRGLIVRRTRESLTESALVTFEDKVVPANHPILATGGSRKMRQAYHYQNGSSIVVGGLDKPGKIMSTEYDLVFVQEAIEVSVDAWESLTTRLRNYKMPYQQIIGDTNPDSPNHWLKRRCDAGATHLISCVHEDNPVFYDHAKMEFTADGKRYLEKLDGLTGPRKMRLRYGRWVQAEGVVYPEWNAAIHLIDRFEIPKDWQRFLAIDFGFVNPFVCLWIAIDPDGRLYCYRELYHTQTLVEDHARQIREINEMNNETIGGIVCDHDAEGRATLERYLERATTAARKEVRAGIQAVASRLQVMGDGKPRLFFLRDSLVQRDPRLEEAKKPTSTNDEWDSYVWDLNSSRTLGEEPLKLNDHGLDTLRYAVCYADDGAGVFEIVGSPISESLAFRAPRGVFDAMARVSFEDGEPWDFDSPFSVGEMISRMKF